MVVLAKPGFGHHNVRERHVYQTIVESLALQRDWRVSHSRPMTRFEAVCICVTSLAAFFLYALQFLDFATTRGASDSGGVLELWPDQTLVGNSLTRVD